MSYRHKIGCSLENLKGIRDFVRKSLRTHVTSEVVLNEIVLALDEMCSNLMIHAHHCNPDHFLELTIDVPRKGKLVFEIIDEGEIFDINQFSEPSLNNLIHEKRKGGLGIRLVKTIMDDVEYLTRNGQFVCRLSKELK
jgi:serine/threonine-protein kinase RsbW